MNDRPMPASPEAERAVIANILLDNVIPSEAQCLMLEDFSVDAHRRLFQRMADLHHEKVPINLVTLSERLLRTKEVDAVGGVAYVASLTDGIAHRSDLSHFIRILREKSILRRLVHLGHSLSERALEGQESPDEILQLAQSQCLQLALESGEGEKDIFVDTADFCAGEDTQPDWLVEGLIERGSNGVVVADPKGAKSLTFGAKLSVCLALGVPFLGLSVKRCKVALVSREDNPATTKRRIKQCMAGMGAHVEELRGWHHTNSKQQSPSLMLDNPREVNNLIRCLQRWGSQFVILDVFNKLHVQDENDNTKVRAVMNQVDRIQTETGAQLCVLHHFNKAEPSQSITRRIRGAGAIAGFAEWIAGIEMADEANQIRRMSFETKVGEYVKPIAYQIVDNRQTGGLEFQVLDPIAAPEPRKRGSR